MKQSCIQLENVNFAYQTDKVLEDITVVIEEGDYVGLVGGNGSGKTTFLKIMLGILRPDSGVVRLFGEDVRTFRRWGDIGYVPQHAARSDAEFPATVKEVVESGVTVRMRRRWFGLDKEDRQAMEWAMEVAEVTHLKERLLGELSGGERQRVFIARALASRPKLLILDEPTAGVDASSQQRFYGFLAQLNRSFGMTIVLISHDLEVVAQEVKTVLCLNRRLVCHVPSREFSSGDYLRRIYGDDMRFLPHQH
jgi:zinc transport system ATP-binding protein